MLKANPLKMHHFLAKLFDEAFELIEQFDGYEQSLVFETSQILPVLESMIKRLHSGSTTEENILIRISAIYLSIKCYLTRLDIILTDKSQRFRTSPFKNMFFDNLNYSAKLNACIKNIEAILCSRPNMSNIAMPAYMFNKIGHLSSHFEENPGLFPIYTKTSPNKILHNGKLLSSEMIEPMSFKKFELYSAAIARYSLCLKLIDSKRNHSDDSSSFHIYIKALFSYSAHFCVDFSHTPRAYLNNPMAKMLYTPPLGDNERVHLTSFEKTWHVLFLSCQKNKFDLLLDNSTDSLKSDKFEPRFRPY